jgi:hypothetical protein
MHETDDSVMEKVRFDDLKVPCYIVKNDWFMLDGAVKKKRRLSLFRKGIKGRGFATICSADKQSNSY